jgi:hypothetical protein
MMEVPFGWRRGVSDGYYGPDLSITTSVLLGYVETRLESSIRCYCGGLPQFF